MLRRYRKIQLIILCVEKYFAKYADINPKKKQQFNLLLANIIFLRTSQVHVQFKGTHKGNK